MSASNDLSHLIVALMLVPLAGAQMPPRLAEQNWTDDTARQFWFIDQGSRLMPLPWFQALERPTSMEHFADRLDRFGFVTDKFDDASQYGFPIGFSVGDHKDFGLKIKPDGLWVGLTCAACHTGKIRYGDVAYLIEGAPAMLDFDAFFGELVDALIATRDTPLKWQRFRDAVPTTDGFPELVARFETRRRVNTPQTPAGFGRVDAFGQIFNQVATLLEASSGTAPPDAPVSYPCLWDIAQHPFVQWNGSAPNLGVGAHADGAALRNVGEVIGVFGEINVHGKSGKYRSSAIVSSLRDIEGSLAHLHAPGWPILFPRIDSDRAGKGEKLYRQQCVHCHRIINPQSPPRRTPIRMISLDEVGTDRGMADQFRLRRAATGVLAGRLLPSARAPLVFNRVGKSASLHSLTGKVAIGALVAQYSLFHFWFKNFFGLIFHGSPALTNYKARPLDGIWATAPYLHNGSVPTLWELLKKPEDRMSFCVGDGAYDPREVGYQPYRNVVPDCPPRTSLVDITKNGNSNQGHPFGVDLSDDEKWQLIEYLKTL